MIPEFKFTVRTKKDLIDAVERFGIVPLFQNHVQGFSVAEHVAPSAWFAGEEGVWEWKGPVIRETGCAYGKFFEKKAAFVSREVFLDLANYRRNGYDFDSRFDEGLARRADRELYSLVEEHGPILSKRLKGMGYYGKDGRKDFDPCMLRLQEQCYVVISDFVYELDKHGKPYGWGVAEYATAERQQGQEFRKQVYRCDPAESYARLLERLKALNPNTEEKTLKRFLK